MDATLSHRDADVAPSVQRSQLWGAWAFFSMAKSQSRKAAERKIWVEAGDKHCVARAEEYGVVTVTTVAEHATAERKEPGLSGHALGPEMML